MSADNKYSLLKRDNLTQVIQILVFRGKKNFFSMFLCISEIYMKFWIFSKKEDAHSGCVSDITGSGKGDHIISKKASFRG